MFIEGKIAYLEIYKTIQLHINTVKPAFNDRFVYNDILCGPETILTRIICLLWKKLTDYRK